MTMTLLFGHLSVQWMIILVIAAFISGGVDAIVGGGGLVQLPVALIAFNPTPLLALGANKVSSVIGTSSAALNYACRIPFEKKIISIMALAAIIGANLGAHLAVYIPGQMLNLLILVALIAILIFLFFKKEFGMEETNQELPQVRKILAVSGGGFICGVWDGLAGPGTGILLIFCLVFFLKYTFLRSTAAAKIVNTGANVSALLVFIFKGDVLWGIALLMAVCNLLGAILGVKYATKYGSGFVRRFFFIIASILICSLGYKVISTL